MMHACGPLLGLLLWYPGCDTLSCSKVPATYVKIPIDEIYIDGLVQNCNDSSVLAMELQQSCTKPPTYS